MDAIYKGARQEIVEDLMKLMQRLKRYSKEEDCIPPLKEHAVLDSILERHGIIPFFQMRLPAPVQKLYRERCSLKYQLGLLSQKEKRCKEEQMQFESLWVQVEHVQDLIETWLGTFSLSNRVLFESTGEKNSYAILGAGWRLNFISCKDMPIILKYLA